MIDEIAGRADYWRCADPARIEVIVDAAAQQLAAFEEERPALVEECFERRQVYLRRICFHLAKIGIGRRFERQARAEAELEIEARAAVDVAVAERVVAIAAAADAGAGSRVRQQLEPAARPDTLDAAQIAEE